MAVLRTKAVLLTAALAGSGLGFALPGFYAGSDRLTPQTIPTQQAVSALYETVFFADGSATLSGEAQQVLHQLVQQLDRETPVGLVISAQSSAAPNGPADDELARQRGEAVREYLHQQGVTLADWDVQHDDTTQAASHAKDGSQWQAVVVSILTEQPVAPGLAGAPP